MVGSGTSPQGRPLARPYGPRRRAWLLVAVTVVALAPLGIGFGVGHLVGGGTGATTTGTTASPPLPDRPPAATVASGSHRVKAVVGAYCWSKGSSGVCTDAPTDAPRAEPVLRVARGGEVSVAFVTGAIPTAVSVGPADGPSHPLVPGNPTRFAFTAAPGSYPVVIATTWAGRLRRQASYLVRVEVG